jgi:hypothetical protein
MPFTNPTVTLPASDISGQITGTQISNGAITTPKLAAGAVTASTIAAGAVSTDKLTVSGAASNLLPDPSFEGAQGAALVSAAGANWALDTTKGGNNSATSVRVSLSSGTAATTDCQVIASMAVLPGDQFYIQTDYAASTFTGTGSIKVYARWLNSTGGTVGFGVLQITPTTDGTWRTASTTVTVPAGSTSAVWSLQAFQVLTVTAWFDNVVIRPVLGTTSIQNGAINTAQLNANAINGMTVTGAVIQTAASGRRMVLQNDSNGENLSFYSGASGETAGSMQVGTDTSGSYVNVFPPVPSGYSGQLTEIAMRNNPSSQTGSVVITSDVLAITGQLINNLTGQTIIQLVADWSGALTLASGYTQNGNSEGNVEYRVITILGTTFVQWRGGFNATYSSGNPVNSGNFLASALSYKPAARRTLAAACSATSSTNLAVKIDFNTDGTATLVTGGSANTPPWVSLNGLMYAL